MAEIRCQKCGRNNPDVLDVCQFCQTPLKADSGLRIGQMPTKKDTGELEEVLPQWLKDVRQQARASAEEETVRSASQPTVEPKVEKEQEPTDFLAGLVSQADNGGSDDIPDWLASINPVVSPGQATSSAAEPESESDFFAQFRQSEAQPVSEQVQKEVPAKPEPVVEQAPDASADDDLSRWFARAAEQPEEIVEGEPEARRQDERTWGADFAPSKPPQEEPASKEPEDLSWLHNLEDASKQTGDLQAPKQDMDWMAKLEAAASPSEPAGSQGDLSWLDNLGGIAEAPQLTPAQPPAAGEDLGWLNNLGGGSEPSPFEAAPEKPASAPPFTSEEDLSWLSNLGGEPIGSQPAQPAGPAPTSVSQGDLSWLNDLGAGSGAPSAPPFIEPEVGTQSTSREAAPLEEAQPDWLRSAAGAPSGPAADAAATDWFTSLNQAAEEPPASAAPQSFDPGSAGQGGRETAPFSDLFSAPSEASPASSQDVDSLFSVEMPDWLSRAEPVTGQPTPQTADLAPAVSEESLAPVDLPSWVQAMRPVEAVISEPAAAGTEDEPEEKEGPLAGLRGVIPGASPIGLSKRPKPVSLKLQVTDEQQASAVLLEKILGSETNPRALIISSFVASQRVLRWVLTALFLFLLGIVVSSRSQVMPASVVPEGGAVSNTVGSVPAGAKVLVVINYEPALAGEMEAIGGPLLDQMVLSRNPQLSFVSTSPNGSALVERLMTNTHVNELGVKYLKLGFLPGGSTGVLGFMEDPGITIPNSEVKHFSDYVMVVLMTDHAETGRIWVEQQYAQKRIDPGLASQSLVVVASAQAGPLLQPYVSAGQVQGMISGLAEAAGYEFMNTGGRPGIARAYWDAFGVGLIMSILLIGFGSLWSLITGIRARRAEAEQG